MNKVTAGKRRGIGFHKFMEDLEERRLLAAPVLDALTNTSVPAGKTLIMPVTASDADSDALSYTLASSDPNFTISQHQSNPFLKLSVQWTDANNVIQAGQITIELLRDLAPRTSDFIRGLAEAGFYNGVTFHRVIPGFMIQGGDPLGTGGGGPGFQYENESNVNALFTGVGQLAMANAGDDTNGSQFFITVGGAQRFLDDKYTLFGQVVRGQSVADAISNVPTTLSNPSDSTSEQSKPVHTVTITNAQIVTDNADDVITIKAKPTAAGKTTTITVNVSDGHGGTDQKQFTVTSAADATNDPAFLGKVKSLAGPINKPIKVHLTAADPEGGTLYYGMELIDHTDKVTIAHSAASQADLNAGKFGSDFLLTPAKNFKGTVHVFVYVWRDSATPPQDISQASTHRFTVAFGDTPIVAKAKLVASVGGMTVPVATFTANSTLAASKYSAQIVWGDGNSSKGIITKVGKTFTVSGVAPYDNPGTYRAIVSIDSKAGAFAQVDVIAKNARARLITDPTASTRTALVVGGTAGDDTITVANATGGFDVAFDGASVGTFAATGRLLVFGQAGNDTISVDPAVTRAAELYGQAGGDTLTAGAGSAVLSGGDGNDSLTGGAGRDILIGGAGVDSLSGGGNDDILIADKATFDGNSVALASVLKEWTSKGTYAKRVSHLKGPTRGLNAIVISGTAVRVDTNADVLSGEAGNDFFLFNTKTGVLDQATDKVAGETVLDVN